MKKLITALVVVGLFTGLNLFAGEKAKKAKKEPKAKPEKQTMELKGKVSKQEKKSKKGEAATVYIIETESGKLQLPQPRKGKKGGDVEAVDFEQYVDKDVVVNAEVLVMKTKKGDRRRIYKVIEIKENTE